MKELICPECNEAMTFMTKRDSILKLGFIYEYGCEDCGGMFEVKRGKKK